LKLITDEISTQIIASARRLAETKHVGKITVRDVLKDLNMTNRVFYNRFRNMDEVLDCIYAESVSRVRESLSIPWDGKTDFMEHIQSVGARTLTLSYESRRHMSPFIFETDSSSSENFVWWDLEIRKLIAAGKELGTLRKDLDEVAVSYSIWCFIRGFNADALGRSLLEDEALALFRTGFGCFLDGMRG